MENVQEMRQSLRLSKGKAETSAGQNAAPNNPAPNPVADINMDQAQAGHAIHDFLNQTRATNKAAEEEEYRINILAQKAMAAFPELFLKLYDEGHLSLPKQVKLVRLFQGTYTQRQNGPTPMGQEKLESIARSLVTDPKNDPLLRLMFGINPDFMRTFLGEGHKALNKTLHDEYQGFLFALTEAKKNPEAILNYPHAVQWSYGLDESNKEEVNKPNCAPFVRGLLASPNAKRTYFNFFYGHKALKKTEYQCAMDILSDYQSFWKILFRHWGRHHVGFVRTIVKAEKSLPASEKTLPALLVRIEMQKALYIHKMKTNKPKKYTGDTAEPVIKDEGSLGRRLTFLNQQRDSQKTAENAPSRTPTPQDDNGEFPAYNPADYDQGEAQVFDPEEFDVNGEPLGIL